MATIKKLKTMNVIDLIMEEHGLKSQTTFWDDFTIADHFGTTAVQDTYNRAFNEWKDNIEYLTELVLVLNHKIWQHHDHNIELERVYDQLWKEADGWCVKNLTGEDAQYYFEVTD